MVRNQALESRKQAAYERGQNLGYTNAAIRSADTYGYDPRSEEWDAFRDGYEDGREFANKTKTEG